MAASTHGRLAAIFFDRDGTIIDDRHYLADPTQVRLISGAVEALRRLRRAGLCLVMISNQSGVGSGRITALEAETVHQEIIHQLEEHSVILDGYRYCYHGPSDKCACPKPNPGMLVDAAQALDISLQSSFMIGDQMSDMLAGKAAKCFTIMLARQRMSQRNRYVDAVAHGWTQVL